MGSNFILGFNYFFEIFEILNFTERNLNLNDLVLMSIEELIPELVQCQ